METNFSLLLATSLVAAVLAFFFWALLEMQFLLHEKLTVTQYVALQSGFVAAFIFLMICPQIDPLFWGITLLSFFTGIFVAGCRDIRKGE